MPTTSTSENTPGVHDENVYSTEALEEFIGPIDDYSARVLCIVEEICLTAINAMERAYGFCWEDRDFCDLYRIAAIHDRERLVQRVRFFNRPGHPFKGWGLVDSVIAVIGADYSVTHGSSLEGSSFATSLSEMWMREGSLSETSKVADFYGSKDARRRHVYPPTRGRLDYARLYLEDEHRLPTVRTNLLFGAIRLACAEHVAQRYTEHVFSTGTDIANDMAVEEYRVTHDGFRVRINGSQYNHFKRMDAALRHVKATVLGISIYDVPGPSWKDLIGKCEESWYYPSNAERHSDWAVLDPEGSYYLLTRTSELAAPLLASGNP